MGGGWVVVWGLGSRIDREVCLVLKVGLMWKFAALRLGPQLRRALRQSISYLRRSDPRPTSLQLVRKGIKISKKKDTVLVIERAAVLL